MSIKIEAAAVRPSRAASITAFRALLLRDLTVLRRNFVTFALRLLLLALATGSAVRRGAMP